VKKQIILTIAVIMAVLYVACASSQKSPKPEETETAASIIEAEKNPETSEIIRITDVEDVRYYNNYLSKVRNYTTKDELQNAASYIITASCVSATTVYQLNKIYTLSVLKVQSVCKGDLQPDQEIYVIELGGRTNFGEYDENCNVDEKAFEQGVERLPDDQKIVIGHDGYYPLSEGENVLLFLGDSSGFLEGFEAPLFDIIGATDGKLYLQTDGIYKRPLPTSTDKYDFTGDTLTISEDELHAST